MVEEDDRLAMPYVISDGDTGHRPHCLRMTPPSRRLDHPHVVA
jgi:hypothetical protein